MELFQKSLNRPPKSPSKTSKGHFTQSYGNKNKNLWSNDSGSILKTVRGINFIAHIKNEIAKLNDKINQNFTSQHYAVCLRQMVANTRLHFGETNNYLLLHIISSTYFQSAAVITSGYML